ncbi:EAL domain-containing protein [Alsobacter sp. SYSU M60028]|uniref:EAL domain-containing protein n=1 Tax=Alsobacter ponti TaxID=2962936 RepID=A0ABT1LG03_9HYPH|nr:EAL domain-containing protein [Alsobacter ponti]
MFRRIKLTTFLIGAVVAAVVLGALYLFGRAPYVIAGLVIGAFGFGAFLWARRGFGAMRGVALDDLKRAKPGPVTDDPRMAMLENGVALMARRVLALETRLREVQEFMHEIRGAVDDARTSAVDAAAGEIEALSGVVRDLAEVVAQHEAVLAEGSPRPAVSAPQALAPQPPAVPDPAPSPGAPSFVREAIEQNRVELLLQPIVGLPGRKVRVYELSARVREGGVVLHGDDLGAAAISVGAGARLGRYLLGHALRVVRHLMSRNRDVPVICPVDLATLADPVVHRELAGLVAADPSFTGRLMFRITQAELRDIGPIEADALAGVRDLGFRFAMDGVTDLRLDAQRLAAHGVSLAKTPASLLLAGAEGEAPTEIHPYDLSGLLARHGVALAVSEVGTERLALDLQDFAVTLGQGHAFGEARPVRQDILDAVEAAPPEPVREADPAPSKEPSEPPQPPPSGPARAPFRSLLRRTTA